VTGSTIDVGATTDRALSFARPAPDAGVGAIRGSWFSARIYDLVRRIGEQAGMDARRSALISRANGTVLELGAGTGLNLPHYPTGLDRLVLCEPEGHMIGRLERRIAQLGRRAEIVRAAAEALPFEDASFDTIVSTFVLCTVADPEAALDEIGRVLRPEGSLLFLEHIRSDEPRLGRWQDRLERPWRAVADGCTCNRRTLERIRHRGFTVFVTDQAPWRRMPPIVRPVVAGRATRTTHGIGCPPGTSHHAQSPPTRIRNGPLRATVATRAAPSAPRADR
jgi:SAM-dependent methyltransferase